MKGLLIYRIASFIIVIVAAFLGFASLFALLMALGNPALLLSVFVIVAVVIYSFTSFIFLIKGIDGRNQLQPKLKDWIKVNAYVAIVFVFMNIFQSITIISNPVILNEALKQISAVQKTAAPVSMDVMIKIVKAVIWFLLVYAIILGMHISATFRLLKQYAHLFETQNRNDQF
ncbi:MAG: hypothetical protein QM725_01800 [Lacibacter sp.]